MSENHNDAPPSDMGATPAKVNSGQPSGEAPKSGTTAPARPVEDWAKERKLADWELAAVRQLANSSADPTRRWPLGKEVTEDEFNQAFNDAFTARHG